MQNGFYEASLATRCIYWEGNDPDNTLISSGPNPRLLRWCSVSVGSLARGTDPSPHSRWLTFLSAQPPPAIDHFGRVLLVSVVPCVAVLLGARQQLTHLKSGRSQSGSWVGEGVHPFPP